MASPLGPNYCGLTHGLTAYPPSNAAPYDFIEKPFKSDRLILVATRANGSSLQPIDQQANTRKPSVRGWQLSTSAAVGCRVIGICLKGRSGVFVCEVDDADHDYDHERDG